MTQIEDSPVPTDALPLAALRDHLRLGTGFADDGVQDVLLERHLRAALSAIEGRTGKALIARDVRLVVTCWRDALGQVLPLAPVSAVARVVVGGVTVPEAAWRLVPDIHRPRVVGVLPPIPQGGVAEIAFTAGFGNWDRVPADLQQAVLMLAAQFHDARFDADRALPSSVLGLIERWRVMRLTGGRACA